MKILSLKKFICFFTFAVVVFPGIPAYAQPPNQPTNIDPPNGQTNLRDKVSMKVSDPNGDILTVKLYGRIKKTDSSFTIIGLPDTQFYTEEPQGRNSSGVGSNAIFKSQTNWIAQHLRDSNIVFVTQLGDCTQNGDTNEVEWKRADTAMKHIENPDVPIADGIAYGICVGNHDQSPIGSQSGTTTFFNQYFGSARFAGRGYYGDHYGSNNDNHYELFSAGGTDFIHISLEYNTNSSAADQAALHHVLGWADGLLKMYRNRKAILSSHWLMGTGMQTSFQGPGQTIHDELKDNPNLILMLCGHVAGEGRRTDAYNGSTVHTLMSDYQSGYGNGGDGLLRIMQFVPAGNLLSVKTFSPWKNNRAGGFLTGPDSEFTLPVNIKSFPLIGTNSGVSSGSSASFTWKGLIPETTYQWYVTIEDGTGIATSSTFEFVTPRILQ